MFKNFKKRNSKIPTKLKSVWFNNGILPNRRKQNIYITFFLGIILGFLLTNFIKYYIILPSTCLENNLRKNDPLSSSETFEAVKNNLIYIGVMTANKYLNSRAKTIYETWGKNIPGDIGFFSSENSETDVDIPLIKLKGVDDVYPPQKKSFMMIKYMYDNFINDYEYFMRADDDVYVRTDRLEKFLKSVNSSKPHYIGQAGRGNQDEFGHLALSNKENFCMGGPGMIFSRETIKKMAPNIRSCIKNLRSTHEDVEIGRCVQKFAGIPCTWSYEMQNIFYHNSSESKAFTASLNHKEVHRAITLHPVKNHHHMKRLHAYIKGLIIKEKEYEMIEATRELHKFSKELKAKMPTVDDAKNGVFIDHLGIEPNLLKWKPKKAQEVLEWDFYARNAYQLKDVNPKHRLTAYVNDSLHDVVRDVMETINRLSKERGRIIDFKGILYGYKRLNPAYAAEYVMDLLLVFKKYRGKKMTVPVPFGPLYVKEFGVEDVNNTSVVVKEEKEAVILPVPERLKKAVEWFMNPEMKNVKSGEEATKKKINFILPLSGRLETFQRFIGDFQKVCLMRSEEVSLVIVSFRPKLGSEDTRKKVEDIVEALQREYPTTRMSVIRVNTTFARAMALEVGASMYGQNDLLFFIDVDMTFTVGTLENIRTHTIQGKQVYYPVVYSELDPDVLSLIANVSNPHHLLIDEFVGYWRAFGFGIVALYHSDLRRVGGLDTSILGWGKEDVDLYEKVIKDKNLVIFRAPDPGLVHVFHQVECEKNLDPSQLVMCEGTRFNTYASLAALSQLLKQKPEIITFKRTLGDN
ncbi:Chondroitin sulfate synthase 1 [Armadillidium vulgare]|nr:Chondroitin sulfate synthase 1 [Armadillidium vulgare]